MKNTAAPRLQCRATGPTSSLIWSRQCPNPAKATRSIRGQDYAVCGVHARSRYVSVYNQSSEKYESAVRVEMFEWRTK